MKGFQVSQVVRRVAELQRALCRAQVLVGGIADGSERAGADALRQLVEMHPIATRMLMIAPAPSSAAIEAAASGDPTAWEREEQTWIAGQLASGASPRLPRLRRGRRETRPDSAHAIRADPRDVGDAPAVPARNNALTTCKNSRP